MSRVFLTGDTHSDFRRLSYKNWEEGKGLTKDDYILILGDFGLLWQAQWDANENYWLKWLSDKPWTTLFLDGNHEQHIRLRNLEQINKFNGIVGKVNDSVFHLKRGYVYTIDDKKFFVMGGAKSIDKEWRIEWVSWWADEEPNAKELEFGLDQLQLHNNKVDYILGHTSSTSAIERLGKVGRVSYGDKLENLNKYFEHICSYVSYRCFYFGHFHEDIQIDDKHHCLYKDIIELKE